jgi:CDP-diacylglycerol--glycerol-3-phosphate 3-phosphatidyltransferase
MLTARIGEAFTRPLEGLVRAFAPVSPNVLTIVGLGLNGVACALFALAGGKDYPRPDLLRLGGVVTLAAALFDMLDGRVARLRGRETEFGAYLDSTMDRYSDMVLYMGLLVLYARLDATPHMVLCWVAAFGSFMTSYARARAESLVPGCPVGMLERPERIVLIVVGALTNRMVAVLWVIAVLSNLTALQRVVFTLRELRRRGGTGGLSLSPGSPRGLREEDRGRIGLHVHRACGREGGGGSAPREADKPRPSSPAPPAAPPTARWRRSSR